MNETLLLADDEEGIRTVLGIALADQGFEVLTAADGREALEIFRRERPDIVLTDIKMPGLDGIELLRRIKRERPETEVVMITGHGDMELAIESLKLEAVDFVTKPIHDDILGIALKRARERIAMRRELAAYTENLEARVQQQAARLIEIERLAAVGQAVEGLAAAFRGMADADDAAGGLRVLNELPCLVSVHDRGLRVVAANALFRERIGEFVGRRSWEFYAGRDAPGFECPAARTFASGEPQRVKAEVVFADGRCTALLVHTAAIRNRGGEAELVLEIAVDVSEVERLRRELAEAQGRLAALGLMLGSVSHGVKGILTGMDAGIYLARSGLRQNDAARAAEGIDALEEMAARIRRLAANVLDFAKERPLERREVEAGGLARRVAELAAAQAARHGIAFAADVPAGLGTFAADEAAVQMALLNILENAADACRQDAAKPAHTVRFTVEAEPDALVFTVADNGVGIAPERCARIFELFESSKGREGTGLGLFIARQIAAQHGGSITVSSTPGEGSAFRVRLPRGPAAGGPGPPPRGEVPPCRP